MSAAKSTSETPLLRVRNLSKHFPIKSPGLRARLLGQVRAVDDVNFDLHAGETLGLVGESGSGKTTLARCLLRAIQPTSGSVVAHLDGRDIDVAKLPARDLRDLRPHMQMIFQDPFSSLNPRMTVGDIVAEPLVIHGIAHGRELTDRVEQMLKKVGLEPEHRQRYPHAFSGGQRQRIGIARALIMNPALVIADEAVSALDVSVQAQVINLLQDLQQDLQLTYLFVAHDLSVVRHICDRVAVMYAGRIVELGTTEELFADPKHPYTRMLLSAVPDPNPAHRMNLDVEGEVADPSNLPSGCSFHPRCPQCFAPCAEIRPLLKSVDGGTRQAACHLYPPTDQSQGGAPSP